jgi:hypothetical protein
MSATLESDEEQREGAQLWLQHPSPWGRFEHRFRRLFVRTAGVIFGAVIGLVAYWIGTFTTDIVHKPIAPLSIADLAEVVVCAIAALALFCGAFLTAFGEYKAPASAYDFVGEARRRLGERATESTIRQNERGWRSITPSRDSGEFCTTHAWAKRNSLRANLMWILIVVAGYATIGLIVAWEPSR